MQLTLPNDTDATIEVCQVTSERGNVEQNTYVDDPSVPYYEKASK